MSILRSTFVGGCSLLLCAAVTNAYSQSSTHVAGDEPGKFREVAQAGYLQGTVELDGRSVRARVLDANRNGLFSDSDDRLLLDLNDDGKFSPLRERFTSHGVLKLKGNRFTIGFSDDERSITLDPLTGTGFLVPKLTLADSEAEVTGFEAELVSNGGVHVSLDRLGSATEVPVGTYRVMRLEIDIKNARSWNMRFAQSSTKEKEGVTVARGETVEFDLLGKLTLETSIVRGSLASGGVVTIQPSLTSETGLYLQSSLVGDIEAQDDNRLTATLIQLRPDQSRDVLAVEGTGFGCGAFCPITFSKQQHVTKSSFVLVQFDSGPLAGSMIKTAGTRPSQKKTLTDELDLP